LPSLMGFRLLAIKKPPMILYFIIESLFYRVFFTVSNLSRSIQVGEFVIVKGTDEATIARIICKLR